jgi:hypothetical protein
VPMSERNSRRATSPTCSPSQPGDVRAQTTTFAHTRRRDTAPPEHTPDAASRRAASPIFATSNRLGGYELAYRLLGRAVLEAHHEAHLERGRQPLQRPHRGAVLAALDP